MYIKYIPLIRINDEEEQEYELSNQLRVYFENHPGKYGDLGFFDIELNEEDIDIINKLAILRDDKKLTEKLKIGDIIYIEPHTYVY